MTNPLVGNVRHADRSSLCRVRENGIGAPVPDDRPQASVVVRADIAGRTRLYANGA
jgi:hypothetical protein